jgi:23S rRNA (cytidine2498-2'-O)-methyltransferase
VIGSLVLDAFVWFTHQPTSRDWLKRELAAKRPDLRFAFSRPGLTTFKVDAARADEPSASSFARAYGRSLGRATSVEEVLAHATALPQPLVLHVFERDGAAGGIATCGTPPGNGPRVSSCR